ncbi:N-acetyltransferase [Planoprotostelium fungivorum]|uniref:N-acetyltransferase n=1 Tax=Planoprotostelium fungivorum TaxID=1890364 RepID=A0A2P6N9I6_9EUKA|nr:N-acetyltransferase [Planoprotostelium fungivorum]
MESHSIRLATKEDAPAILSLIQELADFEKEPQEVTITVETLIEDGWTKNRFICWVAEVDSKVVGIALCYFSYSTWKGTCLYLEDLYVQPQHRSKRIGMSLMTTCIKYAKENNLARVSWQALDWNKPAIDFYEKIGASMLNEWLNFRIFNAQFETYLEKYDVAK